MTISSYLPASWRTCCRMAAPCSCTVVTLADRRHLGTDLGESRRARLLIPIDQQNISTALRQRHGNVGGQQCLADAALRVADREDHTPPIRCIGGVYTVDINEPLIVGAACGHHAPPTRSIAGLAGFLTLIQPFDRPER